MPNNTCSQYDLIANAILIIKKVEKNCLTSPQCLFSGIISEILIEGVMKFED